MLWIRVLRRLGSRMSILQAIPSCMLLHILCCRALAVMSARGLVCHSACSCMVAGELPNLGEVCQCA